ncbi:MAG TPA: ATP-binding protein [Actinomycetota bacterium]
MTAPADVRLTLSVPPAAEQISTVRSFAFAVGRQEGLDPEAIEDLKLALSEVAANGIERGGSGIEVSVRPRPRRLEVSVRIPEADGPPAASEIEEIDRSQIVRALFPSVRIDAEAGGITTTFSIERG